MIEPHLTARTRMVIINSPSNPSGAVLDREEFEKIFQLTSARGIYLMTDECYCKFLYDSEPFSIASLPGAKETVLVAGSLSKTYAMTGWRIGFGLVPHADRAGDDQAAEPLDFEPDFDLAEGGGGSAARSAGIGGHHAGRISQAARFRGGAAARDSGRAVRRAAGRVLRLSELSVAFGKNGIANTLQFAERLLAEAHVAVVPGEAFGTDRHVRISYATSMKELERGLDRIHQFIVKNS